MVMNLLIVFGTVHGDGRLMLLTKFGGGGIVYQT